MSPAAVSPGAGRFAPSPSGDLHLGNLRTALAAWLFARSTGRRFILRIEDLDRDRSRDPRRIIEDLEVFGLDWDGPVEVQSAHLERFEAALGDLRERGLVYECFCTRREIAEAVRAPHGPPGMYPGTCRSLSAAERTRRRRIRTPALRLKASVSSATAQDLLLGPVTGPVDDLVLQRADGSFAYNFAVVVDDAADGIDQVVRGDDLSSSAPRQVALARLLGVTEPVYAHVPLAVSATGARLAKRDGAVTVPQLNARGVTAAQVLRVVGTSLGLHGDNPHQMLEEFDPARLPRAPWLVTDELWAVDGREPPRCRMA